ncbi:hypothetical protein [Microbacter margulisiae]|uniref:Tetratricopeptide repeat protein n=1 Tax=Microbacter margulisiae TaxID=1350067 RepID=A0A7W5H257_9PORP|nr:hypothetical protein [Microbacter margulisiae]MBB3187400.1 hypothetical protein [Microbacter margulisiae]
MRHLLFFCVICLFLSSCHDSFRHDKILLSRADSLMESYPNSALLLLNHITDSRRLPAPEQALYALLKNQAYDKCNISIQSDSLIRIATRYYSTRDPLRAGYAWLYLARIDKKGGNAEACASALLKAGSYAAKSNNFQLQGFVYNDKAIECQAQGQPDSMLFYYRMAYGAFQKAGDRRSSALGLINIANGYYLQNHFNSALYYINLAKKATDPLHERTLTNTIYRFTGLIYYHRHNYAAALHNLKIAAQTSDQYDYNKWIDLAMVYLQTNKLDSAMLYLKKCTNPHEMAPIYYQLWQNLYEKKKDFQTALYYAKKDSDAKDSLRQQALKESFAGMEKRYDYQQYATENKSLWMYSRQKNVFIILLLLVISLTAISFVLFKRRQKHRLLEQQRILSTKEEMLAKQGEEKNLFIKKQLDIQQAMLKNINEQRKDIQADLTQARGVRKNDIAKMLDEKEQEISKLYYEITANVDMLYNQISERLRKQYSNLTSGDILICCLLLAGFESSVITSLLNIQAKSYNMRRTIIRKRLGLAHDMNLADFLANF